jgi:hypothetical protein
MAIMIPGWGQQVGQGLGQIAGAVGDIIDPYAKMQKELDMALADPAKMQEYANMYATNPSMFDPKKFGAKNVERISQVAADPGFLAKRALSSATLSRMQDPSIAKDAGNKALGLDTTAARSMEQIAADQATEGRKAFLTFDQPTQERLLQASTYRKYLGMSKDEEAAWQADQKDKQSIRDLQDAGTNWMKAHKDISPIDIAKALHSGTKEDLDKIGLDYATASGLVSDPQMGKILANLDKGLSAEDQRVQQEEMQKNLFKQQDQLQGVRDAAAEERDRIRAEVQAKSKIGHDSITWSNSVQRTIGAINNPKAPMDENQLNTAVIPALQKQLDDLYEAQNKGPAPRIVVVPKTKTGFLGLGAGTKMSLGFVEEGDPTPKPLSSLDSINKVLNPPDLKKPPEAPSGDPKFDQVVSMIESKKATIESALASPSLPDDVKAKLRAKYGVK